jgi:hypothetical protein
MLMRWGRHWLRLRNAAMKSMAVYGCIHEAFLTIYLPLVWNYDRLHHRRFLGLLFVGCRHVL